MIVRLRVSSYARHCQVLRTHIQHLARRAPARWRLPRNACGFVPLLLLRVLYRAGSVCACIRLILRFAWITFGLFSGSFGLSPAYSGLCLAWLPLCVHAPFVLAVFCAVLLFKTLICFDAPFPHGRVACALNLATVTAWALTCCLRHWRAERLAFAAALSTAAFTWRLL